MSPITLTAPGNKRLDLLIAEGCAITRSQAARWIEAGVCMANGRALSKAGEILKAGVAIEITPPQAKDLSVCKEDIPLQFLYQDADLAAINKPCGMVVHPANGNESGTLVNALLFALDDLSGIGGVRRPGIVHRLDKDTSGVILIAKNDAAHLSLSRQLKDHTMEKHYLAVVEGNLKEPRGRIDLPIGRSERDRKKMAVTRDGRSAQTEWVLLENMRDSALIDVRILTGRTHQIRVHMQSIGHPVAGDPIYGLRNGVRVPRLMLHAHTLAFTHPRTGDRLRVEAPLPPPFEAALRKLRLEPDRPLTLEVPLGKTD
ncbi:MAG TPA: RluA family pseudouridine synthase [Candidatus Limiplasma sp.]|nr:RluA family pseudouridine synthase [Candidatus Limiplasma sp.]HPS80278.1 RluA family pseudouridine synthase [Candidatus Limiplasma sp.]